MLPFEKENMAAAGVSEKDATMFCLPLDSVEIFFPLIHTPYALTLMVVHNSPLECFVEVQMLRGQALIACYYFVCFFSAMAFLYRPNWSMPHTEDRHQNS